MNSSDSQPTKPYSATLRQVKMVQNCVVVSMENENFSLTDMVTDPGEKSLNRVLCYIYLELRPLIFK